MRCVKRYKVGEEGTTTPIRKEAPFKMVDGVKVTICKAGPAPKLLTARGKG